MVIKKLKYNYFTQIFIGGINMDKLKILFIVLVALMFIGGCAQPEPEVIEEQEQEVEYAPEPEPEPAPEPEMDVELVKILENSNKVKSFYYRYEAPGANSISYWFKGDMVKASYNKLQKYNDFWYYHVYVDTEEETAYLVCDDFDQCKGKNGISANYQDFIPPVTPWMIVQSIEFGTISEKTQIDNKDTAVVNFANAEGNQERLWIRLEMVKVHIILLRL